MPFQRILDNLVMGTPGAEGAILVDREGEAIVHSGSMDEFHLKLSAAHQGIIIDRMREVNRRLFGITECETMVTTATNTCLVSTVGIDYLIVMVLCRSAILGLARKRFGQARELLAREIY